MPIAAINPRHLLIRAYLILTAIESALSLFFLAHVSSDSKNAFLFGYSASRLVLLGGMAVFLVTCASILVSLKFSSKWADGMILFLDHLLENRVKRNLLILASLFVLMMGIFLLLVPAERLSVSTDLLERITPVICWGIALGLQTVIIQFLWRGGRFQWQSLNQWTPVLGYAGIVMSVFIFLWVWIAWSGFGINPEPSGWFSPGTPLLATQVFLAFIVGLGLIFWETPIENRLAQATGKRIRFDALAFVILWLTAALVWQLEPLQRLSYFTTAPTPPNFETYPYSDAMAYDGFAQGIMIGVGRQIGMMYRPLYAFFLAFLHLLGGQNFTKVISLQVFFLAVIPGLAYLIASHLGGRPAGIITAILMILREKNAIALTNIIEVSHSKLLLSDVPTLALILLFIFCLLKWLQASKRWPYWAASAGGALGLVVLIRSQALIIVPLVIAGLVMSQWKQGRKIFYGALLFLLGLSMMVIPWVWRNYQVSGMLVVEDAKYYVRLMTRGYTDAAHTTDTLPGETFHEYYNRMNSQIVDYVFQHPAEIARRFTSHFFHNEVESVVYLPLSLKFYDLRSYLKQFTLWDQPTSAPSSDSQLILFLNLIVIALGLGVAMSRSKIASLLIIAIHLGYSFSVVPTGQSGWRFILPVDWVTTVYFSIGLAQAARMIMPVISLEAGRADADSLAVAKSTFKAKRIGLLLSAILILGLSIPVVEWIIPEKYPMVNPEEIIKTHAAQGLPLENGTLIPVSDLLAFIETQKDAVVFYGRALYPDYYKAGEFWGEENEFISQTKMVDRLQFSLTGSHRTQIFLPLARPPQSFPHASNALVVGCQIHGYIRALTVWVDGQDSAISSASWTGLTCPGK